MMIEDPATVEALAERGYLYPSGRVRRRPIGERLSEILHDRPVTSPDTLDGSEMTLGAMSVAIAGVDDPDLRVVISQITNPRAHGRLQKMLASNGGLVLCGRKVRKMFTAPDGQQISQVVSTRFVTRNLDVLESTAVEADELRVVAALQAVDDKLRLTSERVDEFKAVEGQKRRALLGQATKILLHA